MATVLMVSKAVEPPWNDSSKNLVRDLATAMRRHEPLVMVTRGEAGAPFGAAHRVEVYRREGWVRSIRDPARVFRRLLCERQADLWHFFFAPNPRSSHAAEAALRLRRRPSVHTICSAPRDDLSPARLLFADCTVVLSRMTERRFLARGVPAERVRRIPPCAPALSPLDAEAKLRARRRLMLPEDARLVVYPGDLEFGHGAATTLEALGQMPGVHLVMACRAKTSAARRHELHLRDRARDVAPGRVHWMGETTHILSLLGCADVVALPTETLYAKMDYPLALLEAMAMQVPVLVAAQTPAAELAEGGSAGACAARPDAVAEALHDLLGPAGASVAKAGRTKIEGELSPQAMAAAYESLYEELLERGG